MKLNPTKLSPAAVAVVLCTTFTGNVYAQTETSADDFLEEIVVTARKTEESLQDVSLSINAFSADDIATRSIEELEDVALYTPGLTFEDYSNGGFGSPVIRGASQFSIAQLEQNVSTFIDGVYIPRQYAMDVGTLDMERIEIVKGPQSALYGQNAFMGAINYVTRKADLNEFYADVGLVVGTDGRQDLSGEVSFPISPGRAAVKLNATITEFDGDWDNDHPAASAGVSPGTDESIGGWDNSSFGISFLANPTDNLSVEVSYLSFEQDTESRAQSRLELGDFDCGGSLFGGPVRAICGELPDTPIEAGTTNPIGFLIDPRGYGLISETDMLRASISGDITERISVSYQFGNMESEVFSAGNSDRDPINGTFFGGAVISAFSVLPVGGFDYDSHELRVDYTSDSGIYAMLGFFYSDGEDIDNGLPGFFGQLFTDSLDPITAETIAGLPSNNVITNTKNTGYFGRVAVPLANDRWVLSAEGRYVIEEKGVNIVYNDLSEAPAYTDSYFTPRLTADFNLTEENLLYLSYAEGTKAGGSNQEIAGGLLSSEREYLPDENTTIEFGSKNALLDGRMALNAAIFSTQWDNLQVTQAAANGGFFTTSIIGNLGAATLNGIEADVTFAATDAITLNAGVSFVDATYDSGTISQRIDRANICDDIVCAADGDISGNDLPRSSDVQWNLGAQYDGELANGFNYFLRADLAGQSEQFVSETNLTTIPSRTLLNLRGGISGDKWSAELWVKNAADEEYVANAFYIPSPFFVSYVPTWGNKRRIGLTLNYSFGRD
ncbi:MAG: TonB-dependent receptor [Woeseiaceae bacterium]